MLSARCFTPERPKERVQNINPALIFHPAIASPDRDLLLSLPSTIPDHTHKHPTSPIMSTSLPVLGPPPSTVAAQNPNNAKQNEIVNLANTIAENTKIYDDYFVENNLPTPSHGLETPASINLPPRIQKARETVMDASTELQALILGPVLHVHNETFQVPSSTPHLCSGL